MNNEKLIEASLSAPKRAGPSARRLVSLEAPLKPVTPIAGQFDPNTNQLQRPVQPFTDFIAEVVAVSRKSDGAAQAGNMIQRKVGSMINDAVDRAWAEHREIVADMNRKHRDDLITALVAEYDAIGSNPTSRVWAVSGLTMRALMQAVTEAGYTARGRHRDQQPKTTTNQAPR